MTGQQVGSWAPPCCLVGCFVLNSPDAGLPGHDPVQAPSHGLHLATERDPSPITGTRQDTATPPRKPKELSHPLTWHPLAAY